MGMPADHLRGDGLHHIGKSELSGLLGHTCMEDHLQKQVAQLVLQIREVAALDGVHNLIGFFDGVGGDGREILLEVPGAA